MKLIKQFIRYSLITYVIIGLVYWIFIRPYHICWGATNEEQKMKLPGDELISANSFVSTRAITIYATKERIWPRIAQTGQNRGGFNSYQWLENLFTANMKNANSIDSSLLQIKQGDTLYLAQAGPYILVTGIESGRYISMTGWTLYLKSIDSATTRLIVRYPSFEIKKGLLNAIYYYGIFESAHFIMESGMMLGIKKHAEEIPEKIN